MHSPLVRCFSPIAIICFASGGLYAQSGTMPLAPSSKAEPGLELAVNWKWRVAPSEEKEWGMPLPKAPDGTASELVPSVAVRPQTYEVKKGDAIIKIAKRFDMTAAQLRQFNELKDDRIRIGQVLRIPTLEQVLTMTPPPAPPEPQKERKRKSNKPAVAPEPEPYFDHGEAQRELDNVRMQVFLDRENFSPGMIDGGSGPAFLKTCEIYQRTHPDAADAGMLKAKAESAVKQPYTTYKLRAEDFKFITPPKHESVPARGGNPSSIRKRGSKAGNAAPSPPPPPLTIDTLVAADFLGYASAWEFVAERFHCDEAFLHRINPQLTETPVIGSGFQVPDVIPFEIEKALDPPLRPVADPRKPVTAAVVVLSRLEISCEGKLIAVMPLASARPGLSGRGSWTVLDAIPRPRMATKREPRETPKAQPPSAAGGPSGPMPVIEPPLENEQYLVQGPNNPVGIIWINLSKAGSTDPLPYGLHGTGIPAQMRTRQGIGGLRLTNWDIARAARLIPSGAALQWKAR